MINYIVATFDGKTKTRLLDKFSESVLDKQLTVLYNIFQKKKELGIENKIQQITIVCTPSSKDPYPLYYQKDKWKVLFGNTIVFFDYKGANLHYSYDQWLQAMIAYKNIPYHIIMEDDYCIDPTNYTFDLDIIKMYKRKFPNDIGYLCTWCPNSPAWAPLHAAISNGMISSASICSINNILQCFYDFSIKPTSSAALPTPTFRAIPAHTTRTTSRSYTILPVRTTRATTSRSTLPIRTSRSTTSRSTLPVRTFRSTVPASTSRATSAHAQINFSFLFMYNGVPLDDITDTYSAIFYDSRKKEIQTFVNRDQQMFRPIQQLYTESW